MAGSRTRSRQHQGGREERAGTAAQQRPASRNVGIGRHLIAFQAMRIRHDVVEHTRRRQHARQAGAGMRTRADQVESFHFLAAVVRAKPRALRQDRLESEGGASVRGQPVLEIPRRHHARGHDLVCETRAGCVARAPARFSCDRARLASTSRYHSAGAAPATARRTHRSRAAPATDRSRSADAGTG